ncbi:MAG: D-glycero-beta-D-manno-heptose-7-phosphate kinase [Alphaproteobacteria bacterium]
MLENYQTDFVKKLQNTMATANLLVVGDVMLDSYIYGSADRISQEAPIPVFLAQLAANEYRPGGAANVASNIMALGAKVFLLGVIGDDEAGKNLENILMAKGGDNYSGMLVKTTARPTTEKIRYIANKQQMLRLDREDIKPIDKTIGDKILLAVEKNLSQVGAVVISDYGKGVLTNDLLKKIIALAKKTSIPIVVDPKGKDFQKYHSVDYITPNRQELSEATRLPTDSSDEVIAASHQLIKDMGLRGVVATRAEQGLLLVESNATFHFKTDALEVFDVAGAGDTVAGVFATSLAAGLPAVFASRLANAGGGVVVGKQGATDVLIDEIVAMVFSSIEHGKHLMSEADTMARIADEKKQGKKIVLTNGCFDVLHDGHIALLQDAKQQGDILVVLINSDDSIKRLKGQGRPFQPQAMRADALLGLGGVDVVMAFADDTPADVIKKIKPDVLVKGMDYKNQDVVGQVDAGRVYFAKWQNGFSTSTILKNLID